MLRLNNLQYNIFFENVKVCFKYNFQDDLKWRIILVKEIISKIKTWVTIYINVFFVLDKLFN